MTTVTSIAPAVVSDPFFNRVSLLLKSYSTLFSQPVTNNNTFIDNSSNGLSITRTGTPTQGTFSPYEQTGWSNSFNGTTDRMYTTSVSNFGTGDFTIEAWINPSVAQIGNFFAQTLGSGTSGIQVYMFANRKIGMSTATTSIYGGGNITLTLGTWNHIVFSRLGTSLKLFINGVQDVAATDSTNFTDNTPMVIGSLYTSGSQFFAGKISNVRIVKGTAVYTANFTPPTAPLTAITGTSLLTCNSNRFKDNGPNNLAFTLGGSPIVSVDSPIGQYKPNPAGFSTMFNGSNTYAQFTSTTLFDYGTGDFTWEMWIYPTSPTFSTSNGYMLDHGVNLGILSCYNGKLRYYSGAITLDSTPSIVPKGLVSRSCGPTIRDC